MKKIRQYAVVQTVVEASFDRDGRRCEPDRAVITIPAGTLASVCLVSTTHEVGSAYLAFEEYTADAYLYMPGEFKRPILAEQG